MMSSFAVTFGFAFCAYLLLAAGSGTILGLWAGPELAIGLLAALAIAAVCTPTLSRVVSPRALQPKRWLLLAAYVCGPFFVELAFANISVAIAVITGRIRPGILRVKTGMKNDAALTMLANSITLTPGTLSVDVAPESNDLFVHMLNVPEGWETRPYIQAEELFSHCNCVAWVHRITADDAARPEETV